MNGYKTTMMALIFALVGFIGYFSSRVIRAVMAEGMDALFSTDLALALCMAVILSNSVLMLSLTDQENGSVENPSNDV